VLEANLGSSLISIWMMKLPAYLRVTILILYPFVLNWSRRLMDLGDPLAGPLAHQDAPATVLPVVGYAEQLAKTGATRTEQCGALGQARASGSRGP
jgi:hypothetical protein